MGLLSPLGKVDCTTNMKFYFDNYVTCVNNYKHYFFVSCLDKLVIYGILITIQNEYIRGDIKL